MTTEQTLPIFPLSVVLFPEGGLPLRIFEPRYLRMIKDCVRSGDGFVVTLIRSGREAGAAAEFNQVGTVAQIVQWDQGNDGMLQVLVRGTHRVQVLDYTVAQDQLITGKVLALEREVPTGIAEQYAPLAGLLEKVFHEHGMDLPGPEKMQDATWVGCRLSELLPMPMTRRQWLLELTNPSLRLEALAQIAADLFDGTPDSGSRKTH